MSNTIKESPSNEESPSHDKILPPENDSEQQSMDLDQFGEDEQEKNWTLIFSLGSLIGLFLGIVVAMLLVSGQLELSLSDIKKTVKTLSSFMG